MVVMISLGTTRPGGIDVKLINDYAELAPAFLGVLNMMLAYGKSTTSITHSDTT